MVAVVHLKSKIRERSAQAAPKVLDLDRHRDRAVPSARGDIFDIADRFACDRRCLNQGVELFAEGETSEYLYVVLHGWVILHRILEDGRRQILDTALRGAVIGYRAGAELPFAFTAETVTPVEVALIPISRINTLLREGSEFSVTLLNAINGVLMGAFESLTDIGRRTAREAVAHFLLRMDERIRKSGEAEAGGNVSFPLTQEHIGDALGLTAVHVCRTLRALRADGLVETGGGKLSIADGEALAEEAGVYLSDVHLPRLAG